MPPSQDVLLATHLSESTSVYGDLPATPTDEALLNRRLLLEPAHSSRYQSTSMASENTASSMALSQEESMYLTPATSPVIISSVEDNDSQILQAPEYDDYGDISKHVCQPSNSIEAMRGMLDSALTDTNNKSDGMISATESDRRQNPGKDFMDIDIPSSEVQQNNSYLPSPANTATPQRTSAPRGMSSVDMELDRSCNTRAWDVSDQRPVMRCPSALFQPYSKFIGTQQSDRHTYNVEVTILTIDMDQCSVSGYLSINGLTPEHPTLQTFFTGQIVGGPNQRYSFKTTDPAWGTRDKDDLQHWLRFPPWRPLSAQAKRDMSFNYPLNGEPWWTQDHVFMRWKEHFLVPDHKQSNITGASFEGFYYICLSLWEGKISGVYFHSQSEKYQQLELVHETKRESGVLGVSPLIELR